MFKVINKNIRARCEICSKVPIKTPEQPVGDVLVSLLLTLNIFHTFSSVSIVNFEQINSSWVGVIVVKGVGAPTSDF